MRSAIQGGLEIFSLGSVRLTGVLSSRQAQRAEIAAFNATLAAAHQNANGTDRRKISISMIDIAENSNIHSAKQMQRTCSSLDPKTECSSVRVHFSTSIILDFYEPQTLYD